MQRIYVPLARSVLERLAAMAERERRRPQDQAAILLERALFDVELGDKRIATGERLVNGTASN